MPKGVPNKRYTGEFKQMVVEAMMRDKLSYKETARQFDISCHKRVADWHYRHKQYVQMLKDKGVQQSMNRKGNCYDNSVMENFFGHLKSELLYLQEFESMEHFKAELIEYIDYYNNRRIKARLKGLPPALHRQQALLAA